MSGGGCCSEEKSSDVFHQRRRFSYRNAGDHRSRETRAQLRCIIHHAGQISCHLLAAVDGMARYREREAQLGRYPDAYIRVEPNASFAAQPGDCALDHFPVT